MKNLKIRRVINKIRKFGLKYKGNKYTENEGNFSYKFPRWEINKTDYLCPSSGHA